MATALFAHCFTCGKDVLAARRISAALAARGIATLRFDFTGLGSSDGDFANTTFSSNVEDLVHAANYLNTEFAGLPVVARMSSDDGGWIGCEARGCRAYVSRHHHGSGRAPGFTRPSIG